MNRTESSAWSRRMGLRAPIVCAPMGGVAGGALAAAVSRAGALGMIGMGSAGSRAVLERELALLDTGGAPFGIGMVGWGIERDPAMFERALEARPAVVSVSFVDWADPHLSTGWISAAHAVGALAVTQVATVDEARRASDHGVDALVARGAEGGGHGDHAVPRDRLLDAVLAAVAVPVLAGGGVSDAADLERVLEAGASAAWIGTAFSACEESLTTLGARRALIAATGADTVVSRVLDVALRRPWPERFPERLLRTEFVDRWHGREAELARDESARAEFRAALDSEDYAVVPVDAGTGVGSLVEVRSAAEVVDAFVG